ALAARQFTDARLSAGLELAFDLPLAGGVLTPSLKASVTQRVGDRIDNADAYYAIAPDLPFRLTGPANARTYGTLGAGLGFRVNDAVTAQIAYQADISGGGFHDNRLTAKAQVRF
ncbi:autotransporter domain-containing protein, partial [Camelimonas fluminis]